MMTTMPYILSRPKIVDSVLTIKRGDTMKKIPVQTKKKTGYGKKGC